MDKIPGIETADYEVVGVERWNVAEALTSLPIPAARSG